jgi:hypothetical protein
LEDLDEDERIISKSILRVIVSIGRDWIHMAQDRDLRLGVVNTVMNLEFHKRWVIS